MPGTVGSHVRVVRSSESVPLTWAEQMAGLDYSAPGGDGSGDPGRQLVHPRLTKT